MLQTEFFKTYKLWRSYIASVVMAIVVYSIAILILNYVLNDVSLNRTGENLSQDTGFSNLIGFIMWWFGLRILPEMADEISRDAKEGVLEQIVLGGNVLQRYAIGTVAALTISLIEGLTVMFLVSIFSGFSLSSIEFQNLSSIVFIVFVSIIGSGGMMLLFAGIAFVYNSISRIALLVGNLSLFLTQLIIIENDVIRNVVFGAIPIAKGTEMVRNLLVNGEPVYAIDYAFIVIQSLIFLCLGIFSLVYFFNQASEDGKLSSYSL
ncbi:MAG: hypothetical protein AAGD96_33175 [Chloroflexota bacterium]